MDRPSWPDGGGGRSLTATIFAAVFAYLDTITAISYLSHLFSAAINSTTQSLLPLVKINLVHSQNLQLPLYLYMLT